MKKLKKLRLISPSGEESERLVRWLHEWNLLRSSLNDTTDEMNYSYETVEYDEAHIRDVLPAGSVASFDGSVEVGQIRLLSPNTNENMVFIVVVSISEDGSVGFVPFGQLAEPATPDELLSGRDKAVVRIYCLWNMRIVSADIIGESWVVDTLDASEQERLLRAIDVYESDGCLSDDLLMDAGPPLIHPEDPRREYKNYERQRIDKGIANKSTVNDNTILYKVNENQEFLKAAESPKSYDA